MFYDKRHAPEVHEWYYRMMNDPNQWEKLRYKDTIDVYNSIIEEFQRVETCNRSFCLSFLSEKDLSLKATAVPSSSSEIMHNMIMTIFATIIQ